MTLLINSRLQTDPGLIGSFTGHFSNTLTEQSFSKRPDDGAVALPPLVMFPLCVYSEASSSLRMSPWW